MLKKRAFLIALGYFLFLTGTVWYLIGTKDARTVGRGMALLHDVRVVLMEEKSLSSAQQDERFRLFEEISEKFREEGMTSWGFVERWGKVYMWVAVSLVAIGALVTYIGFRLLLKG